MPIEPDPCVWAFPPASSAGPDEVVALGADLAPGTLLAAYRAGLFPMPVPEAPAMVWWSPDPRGVIPLDGFHLSRSLRRTRSATRSRSTAPSAPVVEGCADPARPGGWITPEVRAAYTVLHALGWAHSVEAWDADGTLAGGLYGVEIGGLFAAESKFHVRTDASKAAVAGLVERLREARRPAPARRPVDDRAPADAGRGRRPAPRSTCAGWRAALPLPPALG